MSGLEEVPKAFCSARVALRGWYLISCGKNVFHLPKNEASVLKTSAAEEKTGIK
jgi:hypothetical protein